MFEDFTADELKAYRKELATMLLSGTVEVRFNGRLVRFDSADKIRETLTIVDAAITEAITGVPNKRQIRVTPSGGY